MNRKLGRIIRITVFLGILLAVARGVSGCGDGIPDLQRGAGERDGPAAAVELNWLDALDIPPADDAGDIDQAWQLDENLVLLHALQGEKQSYHLFHMDTGKRVLIVPPRENAVLEKIAEDRLYFVVKKVAENGNQEFPHRLVFDLGTYKASRQKEAFFRRDAAFGGVGSPLLTLDGIYPRGDDVVLDFAYAGGGAPTGMHPLTVADYSGRSLSLRIYNAGAREGSLPAAGLDSLVGRITLHDLPPSFPVERVTLFKSGYPYGAAWYGEVQLEQPSVKVEISLREKAAYHVRMVPRSTGLVYVVEFKPDGPGTVHGLYADALADLSPEEVATLYWRARQERSLGALRALLTDDAEVGSRADALMQTEREWQRGRMMVLSFSIGEAKVHGDRAVVPVSYRQTGWDGRLVTRENTDFGLSKIDGVWRVDLSDHILALAR